jgi:hypothetical protein
MNDFNWKAIVAILVVIGWLIYQFTLDVKAADLRIKEIAAVHNEDIKAVIEEFSDIGEDEIIMLEKLAANEESHKNIKERLDRMDNKLDKIHDLIMGLKK